LRYALEAVKRGYAFIVQNERGRYFSEGKWEILGKPQTDGYDTLSWIAKQPWSNGKVGTLGCSSSAEWQLALAGRTIRRMRRWCRCRRAPASARSAASRSRAIGTPAACRATCSSSGSTASTIRCAPSCRALTRREDARAYPSLQRSRRHQAQGRLEQADQAPAGRHDAADLGEPPRPSSSSSHRTPADPAWRKGGLYHDDMGWGVPALWFNSWYDVSIGPNLELFNHARGEHRQGSQRQPICGGRAGAALRLYRKLGPNTVVGERDMGDTSFDVDGAVFGWFDRWLKGDHQGLPATTPHVRYFMMGANKWQSNAMAAQGTPSRCASICAAAARQQPERRRPLSTDAPPAGEAADRFRYDPMNPVQTIGGGDCCNGGIVIPGAFDQRPVEARDDVLVYTSEPLKSRSRWSGFVDAVLKVSSSAKDTDFAVKLVDVAPDGTAWIIGDTIFRARYRDGFDKPAMMEPGQVYTISRRRCDQHPVRHRPSHPGRGHLVQLPQIRPQPQHRRAERDNAIHHERRASSVVADNKDPP
jgi:putative CocE/NonD family hydrolase